MKRKLRQQFAPLKRSLQYRTIVLTNALRRLTGPRIANKFVFVLSPPYCGSTLLVAILSTSGRISLNNVFDNQEGQGLPSVRKVILKSMRWDANVRYPWEWLKQEWLKYWDPSKPLLLEKSPPNIMRAQELAEHFQPAYFVILVRNPYVHVDSILRRNTDEADAFHRVEDAAAFALRCLRYQKKNAESLERVLVLKYEELGEEYAAVRTKLVGFLPELDDMPPQPREYRVKGKSGSIGNKNQQVIAKFTAEQRAAITAVFAAEPDVLRYFGYELVP